MLQYPVDLNVANADSCRINPIGKLTHFVPPMQSQKELADHDADAQLGLRGYPDFHEQSSVWIYTL